MSADKSHYGQLPHGWGVYPIGHLFSIVGGGTPSTDKAEYWGSGVPWFSSADINENGDISARRSVTQIGVENSSTNVVPEGSVVIVTRIGIGKVSVLPCGMCFSQDNQALVPIYNGLVNNRYLFYFMLHAMQSLRHSGRGTTISGITKKQIKDVLLFLPPAAEQNRIVVAIESAFAIIDEIERNKVELLNAIADAKSKMLSLAVRGKLVPQDPNDEPASVLLERVRTKCEALIKDGKLKPKKSDSAVMKCDDNSYYARLPKKWELCRLGNISEKIQYGLSNSAQTHGNFRLLRITDIQGGRVDWDSVPYTTIDEEQAADFVLCENDIVFARTGATVGKSYMIYALPAQSVFASYLIRVKLAEVNPKYIKVFFESKQYWKQIIDKSVGTGQPNVNGSKLREIVVPLPPFTEQQRIVDAIEIIFEQLDGIATVLA